MPTQGRGRPKTFTLSEREYLAELIRQHGIRGSQRVSTIPVSMPTLTRIGREFGMVLPKGKRRSA